jgi:hypothetical protein
LRETIEKETEEKEQNAKKRERNHNKDSATKTDGSIFFLRGELILPTLAACFVVRKESENNVSFSPATK